MRSLGVAARCGDRAARLAHAAISLLVGGVVSLPAFGDLDRSFSNDGLISLHVGGSAEAVLAVPDGKLVLAGGGTTLHGDSVDFVVARLLKDGSTDPAFGPGGIVNVDFFGHNDSAEAIVLQKDGKLVVAGSAAKADGTREVAIVRLKADGTLDPEFGEAGKSTFELQGSQQEVHCMVLQQDGKLVLGGGTTNSTGISRRMLMRLNADGTLDSTFGTSGMSVIELVGEDTAWINDVALESDGRLVAASSAVVAGHLDIDVARVLPDGRLDISFGSGGATTLDFGGEEEGLAVAIQADSRIVIGGAARFPEQDGNSAALIRLKTDGSLDTEFGGGGISTTGFGGNSMLNALALETSGKIVATGSRSTAAAGPDLIVARFNADGSVDASFGDAGFEIADFGRGPIDPSSQGDALIRQSDGKYVAVGPNSTGDFAAARFDAAGTFPGIVGLTHTNFAIEEAELKIIYTVRRTGGRSGAVSVSYATAGVEALPGQDFESNPGTLAWPDGDASDRTIQVNILDDHKVEPAELFALALSAPKGGTKLAARKASTRIFSDDGAGSIGIGFVFDPIFTMEGDSTLQVRVGRAGGSEGAVGVSYSTTDGTAKAGEDFGRAKGKLEWADGESGIKSFAVKIRDDAAVEETEDFSVRLSDPTGGATLGPLTFAQQVLIDDNDPGVMFKLGEAAAAHENIGSLSLTVSRVGGSAGEGSVSISTAPGTAMPDSDFVASTATLHWSDGDAGDKTFRVEIKNDKVREAVETFGVQLSNPTGAVILGSNATATVTILDDDAPVGGGSGGNGRGGSGGGGGLGAIALAWLALLLFGRQASHELSRGIARSSGIDRPGLRGP